MNNKVLKSSKVENVNWSKVENVNWLKMENYSGRNVIAFSKGELKWNGVELRLSNMCTSPIKLGDLEFQSAEAAYIACGFDGRIPQAAEIQQKVATINNGMMVKRKYRFKKEFESLEINGMHGSLWRLDLMLWLNWQKCLNDRAFRNILLSIPDSYAIVENQNRILRDKGRWGCKNKEAQLECDRIMKELESVADEVGLSKKEIENRAELGSWKKGTWVGRNYQGKILMECRRALRSGTLPRINIDDLNKADIYILGKKVKFEL